MINAQKDLLPNEVIAAIGREYYQLCQAVMPNQIISHVEWNYELYTILRKKQFANIDCFVDYDKHCGGFCWCRNGLYNVRASRFTTRSVFYLCQALQKLQCLYFSQ